MPRFKTYARMYHDGKPVGHEYILIEKVMAKNKAAALRQGKHSTARFNRIPQNKRQKYAAKITKVKQLGKIKHNRRSSSLESQLRRLF